MALVRTSDGDSLNEDAAASYELMNAAFFAHFGKRLSITSGARTYAQQVTAFTNNYVTYNTGTGDRRWYDGKWWWRKKDTYPGQYATVASPGTSNHEYPPGRAADFGSGVQTRGSAEHNWMLANAGKYGWEWTGRTFITVEPWHWEKTRATTAGGTSTAFPTTTGGFLMALSDAQQAQLYDALVVNGGQYFMPEAIVNVLRTEIIPRLDGIVARTDASNTNLGAVLGILGSLDSGAAISPEQIDSLGKHLRDGLGAEVAAELAKRLAQ